MPIKQEVCDEDEDEGEDGEKSSGVPVSAANSAAMQWPGAHKVTNLTVIYCRVPARWGLQQTHPGLWTATIKTRVRVHSQVD